MRVVLGVTGGIAAYKAAELIRSWRRSGDEVRVMMTAHATRFITPMTLGVLSGHEVFLDMFPEHGREAVDHVDLGKWADVLVVAPATANILAKFARGLADDQLSTYYLAHPGPVVLAPAMNVHMWDHPAVRENLEILIQRGVILVEPESGELACGDWGQGRLAEIPAIVAASRRAGNPEPLLTGRKILVTAGPTREPIDPVRFLSNPSTGKMGVHLAAEAYREGATVTLVHGPLSTEPPYGVTSIPVSTAGEMTDAVLSRAGEADLLLMTAAVGDFKLNEISSEKIRRTGNSLPLTLEPTADILASVRKACPDLTIVAFAAETTLDETRVREKMAAKGADFIVANDVSDSSIGFASDHNEVFIYPRQGPSIHLSRSSKSDIARRILQHVVRS